MFDRTCSPGRRAGRYAISAGTGLAAAAAMPVLLVGQYPMVPAVMCLAALYGAKWDCMAALIAMAFSCAGAYIAGGAAYALIMLLTGVLPGAWVLAAVRRRMPQPSMAASGMLAAVLGTAAAVPVFSAFAGGDAVSAVAKGIDAFYEALLRETAARLSMYEELIGTYTGRVGGALPDLEAFKVPLEELEALYSRALPGMLVSGCVLAGLLCAFFARRALSKKGVELPDGVPLTRWRLPYRLATLLVAAMIALRLLSGAFAAASQLFYAAYYIAFALFLLRAVGASVERLAAASGGRRAVMIVLAALLVTVGAIATAALLFGGAVAIFGKDGDLYRFVMKRRQKNGGNGGTAQ